MHKYQLLRQRAEEFRQSLLEHATNDADVEHFLNMWISWYFRIQADQIKLPCHDYQLGVYFENPDISPLAERYSFVVPRRPLAKASTNFSEAIADRLSDPAYIARLKAAGEAPSAILDEEPPANEEA